MEQSAIFFSFLAHYHPSLPKAVIQRPPRCQDPRVNSGWTQLELELGEEGGVYACNLDGGGRQARMGKGWNEEDASLHQSRQGQGLKGQVCACDPGEGGLQARGGGKGGSGKMRVFTKDYKQG